MQLFQEWGVIKEKENRREWQSLRYSNSNVNFVRFVLLDLENGNSIAQKAFNPSHNTFVDLLASVAVSSDYRNTALLLAVTMS